MHTDMQKDYVVHEVNSVSLNPDGLNVPVHVQIESVLSTVRIGRSSLAAIWILA